MSEEEKKTIPLEFLQLSWKERKFAQSYAQGNTYTQAARDAGYSEGTAAVNASSVANRLL